MDVRQQLASEFRGRGLLWRVVGVACGRVYGAWSGLWRVVGFMARGRVYGVWSGNPCHR
jgi:hypothetical protein